MLACVENKLSQIRSLCQRHKVASLYLIGSAAKGTFSKGSDLDFLVNFRNDMDILDYADNYFLLKDRLAVLLDKDIDLVSEKTLKNPYLISDINATKIALYAESESTEVHSGH